VNYSVQSVDLNVPIARVLDLIIVIMFIFIIVNNILSETFLCLTGTKVKYMFICLIPITTTMADWRRGLASESLV